MRYIFFLVVLFSTLCGWTILGSSTQAIAATAHATSVQRAPEGTNSQDTAAVVKTDVMLYPLPSAVSDSTVQEGADKVGMNSIPSVNATTSSNKPKQIVMDDEDASGATSIGK